MTEAEWNACNRPSALLASLTRASDGLSHRKMHLFGCACCRRVWHLLRDPRSQRAVEVAEQYADGLTGRKELAHAREAAEAAARAPWVAASETALERAARAAAQCAMNNGTAAGRGASQDAAKAVGDAAYFGTGGAAAHPGDFWHRMIAEEEQEQARLFRDNFGPLSFRKVRVTPSLLSWNDGTVVRIAQGIYDERTSGRMPILADALLDAGCDDDDILSHCREQGAVHARGCWVIDLLLGKE